MSRAVPEWVGKTDDTPAPPRVRLRVFDRFGGFCYLCTRKIAAGEYWECDHAIALTNGGANREKNLAPICRNCCKGKTARDVAEKSKIARVRAKHLGIPKAKRHFQKPDPKKWRKIGFGRWERIPEGDAP